MSWSLRPGGGFRLYPETPEPTTEADEATKDFFTQQMLDEEDEDE